MRSLHTAHPLQQALNTSSRLSPIFGAWALALSALFHLKVKVAMSASCRPFWCARFFTVLRTKEKFRTFYLNCASNSFTESARFLRLSIRKSSVPARLSLFFAICSWTPFSRLSTRKAFENGGCREGLSGTTQRSGEIPLVGVKI
jgi:hypothetical protein